nr:PREDICTED: solute carrier family 35 member G1 [Anolis carolinensis]|eukprot:XP_003223844.2 PREDICTED: solute carrier family 35 member G1 [Anolis carolinensis]
MGPAQEGPPAEVEELELPSEAQEPCLEPDLPSERDSGPSGCPCCGSCASCLRGSFPWRPRVPGIKKKRACPGLGLFYTVLSAFFFAVASLFLKKIQNLHAVEVSAIRCIFQMSFVLPGMIYQKTGFFGPRNKLVFLFFRGLFGSSAMILLYYAIQVMPLADAIVITFSSPVFTSLFAWIFLKEKYSLWDLLFTLFTITGVILIARPPFLFGSKVLGIEGEYTDHLRGSIAALASAVAMASTFVILRKQKMSSKKKPSGAFHRKRRLQHSQEDKSQAKALKRFFTTSPSCQTGKPETTKLTESDHADDGKIPISEPLPGPSTSQDLLTATSAIPLPPSCIGITGTDTEDVDEDSLRDEVLPSTSRQAIESEQRRDPLLFLSNDCGEWPLKINDEARKIIVE